jgi:hypothetical protein
MPASVFKHTGDFEAHTKENRALRFVHKYFAEVTSSLKLEYPDTEYYAPSAVFFDTKNVTYTGAKDIKTRMLKLFSPFDKLALTGMSFLVVDESAPGKSLYTVNAETMVSYYVKGDPVPILVPRLFVFEIRDGENGQGWDALQFFDIKLYWDTALLVDEIEKRKAAK